MGSSASSHEPPPPQQHRGEDIPSLEELRSECVELELQFTSQSTSQELLRLIKEHKANTSSKNLSVQKFHSPSSYCKLAADTYEELVCAIIRPPRAIDYNVQESLGESEFRISGLKHERVDFAIVNDRGQRLQCSWWREKSFSTLVPCCIYLHGNSSCRAEAVEVVKPLLQSGLSVFAFDFSGSGHSEGEYVSLGYYETMDLKCVIAHLRETNRVSTICLWGRSMGAVTALMMAELDPSICCMICDSPFSSLRALAKELVDAQELQIPKFALGLGIKLIRSSVKSRAKFDINSLEVIDNVDKCFVPCLFACAEGDRFILPKHAMAIHQAYAGDKNLVRFQGDHNSPRPRFFLDSALIFLQNAMRVYHPSSLAAGGGGNNHEDGGGDEEEEEEAMIQQALLLSMMQG
ncbi:hypothetical protein BASA81_000453 [Batrachochytrium salamandrivorans]|nr:hypothetical protein BASA81_000453 [Batrachochytrium salamandrivorans]